MQAEWKRVSISWNCLTGTDGHEICQKFVFECYHSFSLRLFCFVNWTNCADRAVAFLYRIFEVSHSTSCHLSSAGSIQYTNPFLIVSRQRSLSFSRAQISMLSFFFWKLGLWWLQEKLSKISNRISHCINQFSLILLIMQSTSMFWESFGTLMVLLAKSTVDWIKRCFMFFMDITIALCVKIAKA